MRLMSRLLAFVLVVTGLSGEAMAESGELTPQAHTTCVADQRTACLLNGRFRVTMRFRNAFDNGAADRDALVRPAPALANPSFETALFYFNSQNNVEVFVKMLDQGNVDPSNRPTIAVLFGSATPLRVELTITDTLRDTVRTYNSEFNRMQGQTDFTAFLK